MTGPTRDSAFCPNCGHPWIQHGIGPCLAHPGVFIHDDPNTYHLPPGPCADCSAKDAKIADQANTITRLYDSIQRSATLVQP